MLSQELQDAVIGLLGLLSGFVIWQLQRIQSRFDNLIGTDHVHRQEFDALRNQHDKLTQSFFALQGEFHAHRKREVESGENQ